MESRQWFESARCCTEVGPSASPTAFSPDGRFISGSDDKTLKLWDANGSLRTTLKGHDGSVYSVAFSPDGRFISGSDDKTLKLWDAANGAQLKTFNGHGDTVESVAFSPDGRFIVSGSEDNTFSTLKLWDVANTRRLLRCLVLLSMTMTFPSSQYRAPRTISA